MSRTSREINAEILDQLDIVAEYAALGVKITGAVRVSGIVSCRAPGRKDRNPSGWISTRSGIIGDSGGKDTEASTTSLWDFAVRAGKFSDWREARKAYAEKAGVKIGRTKQAEKGKDWRSRLDFQSWSTPGNEVLAQVWCLQKPGVVLEAIKAAGGRLAYYPCYIDEETKELKHTRNCQQVIAFPCYGQWLLDVDPVAWQIFDCSGQPFDVTPRKTPPTEPRVLAKDLSIGPTAGTLCGLSSLMMLCDPEQREKIKLMWKVEGLPDLLTLWATIPENQREEVAVVTQAGGATADVHPHQVKILAGLPIVVVGDADEAGQIGAEKWARALHGIASEVRIVKLPWAVEAKHGKDVRDFLTEVRKDA